MRFEDRCAELYYDCILLEIRQILAVSTTETPKIFVQKYKKLEDHEEALEEIMPIRETAIEAIRTMSMDQQQHLEKTVQIRTTPIDPEKLLKDLIQAYGEQPDRPDLQIEKRGLGQDRAINWLEKVHI